MMRSKSSEVMPALVSAAWAALTPQERQATDEAKKTATAGDKPVGTQVPNTEKAREARKKATEYIRQKSKP
jgi:dihydrodipicolinate synthase/N-acetylneuraminate lyase